MVLVTRGDWLDQLRTPDPAPVRLSESLRQLALRLLYDLLADQLEAEALFELAWLKKYGSPSMVARRGLTDEGIDELVHILVNRRSVPTVGFWRRHAA